mmetsp:Transcript_20646/g.45266  ORF Transcript_20646/g.45266 Transcript_20646/m.45266 type:complete len:386 (-) Transcript_20646:8-1165(-)
MAFAGIFSPLPSLPCAELGCVCKAWRDKAAATHPPPIDFGQRHNAVSVEVGSQENPGCAMPQFAPLLPIRRTQVFEEPAAGPDVSSTSEEQVDDALRAFIALTKSARSARALRRRFAAAEDIEPETQLDERVASSSSSSLASHSELQLRDEGGHLVDPTAAVTSPRSTSPQRARCEAGGDNPDANDTSPVSSPVRQASRLSLGASASRAVTDAAASVAGAFLSATVPVAAKAVGVVVAAASASQPAAIRSPSSLMCVEGVLQVDCGLFDKRLLQETLRAVLLRLLGHLAQVEDITVSVFDALDGGRVHSVAYRVRVADPYDVVLLRETLLLEAESGGARRLLPLLTEQLADDGLPTPKHLKVRVEVGESGMSPHRPDRHGGFREV